MGVGRNEVSNSGSLVSVQSPLTRGHLFVAFRGLLGRLVRLGRCRVCDDGQMGSLLMGLLVGVFVRDGEKIWEFASFFEAVAIAMTSVSSKA